MHLASDSRPDISFAVHQCARFTHCPKRIHEDAVKRVCRCLQGTRDKGIVFKSNKNLNVDCHVDADFAGLWGNEDDQDPVCVKSRTGYVLIFGGCPLLWVSKLQTEVALSTTESEYVALSQSCRDIIPCRYMIKEIIKHYGLEFQGTFTHSKMFEDNEGCISQATAPKMSPQSKHIAVKMHHFLGHVKNKTLRMVKVTSAEQKANIFTKGLAAEKFKAMRMKLCGF